MTPRGTGRTRPVTRADVLVRAASAHKYLEVAALVADAEDPAERHVAASLAALGAIAAADAICGARLGVCARGQDHGQAADLLSTVPSCDRLAADLRAVLRDTSNAHYGTTFLSSERVASILKQAGRLVDAVDSHLR